PGPSPALPLLAVRAARRALAANPDDAAAWLRLAQAYRLVDRATWEGLPAPLPPLAYLRHVQVTTALKQALALDPDSPDAHGLLADVFDRWGFLDLAHTHRAAQARLTPAGAARAELTDSARRLEELVQDAENLFLIRTEG